MLGKPPSTVCRFRSASGTGLLIVIGVALDLVQKIGSHLVMRKHPRPPRLEWP
jgi:preprotein translocase subunit SecY